MASISLKRVVVSPSASPQEARHKAMLFFKDCCRSLPQIMDMYVLRESISLPELRSKVTQEFRKHAHVGNPQVLDALIVKGQEELINLLSHAKQRHHVMSQWVVGREGLVQPQKLGIADHGESEFLKKFYMTNSS